MQNIDIEVGDNLGGLEVLYLADVEDVDWESFPEILNNVAQSNIVLLGGKSWYMHKFVQETLSYSEDEEVGKLGIYYKARVSGTLPKDSVTLSQALKELRGRRLIIVYKDNNGNYKLLGDRENYMEAVKSFDTENNYSGRNAYKLKFEGKLLQESAFYQGDFSGLPDELTGIFDDTYDLTFE